MNLNIIFKDFPKICRLCLSTESLQPILKIGVLDVLYTITDIKYFMKIKNEILYLRLKMKTNYPRMCVITV
ncbi:hypothetical protein NQ318_019219 [Aromia moschata]|uniref:Uncharacterized protein n=1 Tax=Aromia moschata TaxID=1265417 RepID=A0AAV8YZH3_9CUCU|nr:hypothetical protein NQ318_019219 [Aromia moschata]